MSFQKRYSLPDDPEKFVFLTWESGYKNVKLYHEQRVVAHITDPGEIKRGFSMEDEVLKSISMRFTEQPMRIELSIDDEQYYPDAKGSTDDLSGLVLIFWVLAAFAFIGSLLALAAYGFNFSYPIVQIEVVIDFIAISSYIAAALSLRQKQTWGYFLGGSVFLLTSFLFVLGIYSMGFSIFGAVILLVRIGFLFYIVTFFKRVMTANAEAKGLNKSTDEILDEF